MRCAPAIDVAAAASLFVALAVATSWAHSWNHVDSIVIMRAGTHGILQAGAGKVAAFEEGGRRAGPTRVSWVTEPHDPATPTTPPDAVGLERLGFHASHQPTLGPGGPSSQWLLIVPHGFVVTLCLAMPLGWLTIRRRVHADLIGRCRVCGYDCRASPDRCPECGAARAA